MFATGRRGCDGHLPGKEQLGRAALAFDRDFVTRGSEGSQVQFAVALHGQS